MALKEGCSPKETEGDDHKKDSHALQDLIHLGLHFRVLLISKAELLVRNYANEP